jgi:cytochrome c556
MSLKRMDLRYALATMTAALLCVGICFSTAWAKEKHDRIHDQMEKVHEGRKSPLRQTQGELAKDMPSWDVVDKELPAFKSMSDALTNSRREDIRDSAGGYADAVTALATAAKNRDLGNARTALKLLKNSCSDCHFKGGPGGSLENEHEHEHKNRSDRQR